MLTPGLRSLGKMDIIRNDKDGIIGGSIYSVAVDAIPPLFIEPSNNAPVW